MRAWWEGLQVRERYALLIGIAVLLLLSVWLAANSLSASVERKQQHVEALREDVAWMRRAAAEAAGLQGAGTGGATALSGSALLVLADESVKTQGIGGSLRRIQPEGQAAVRVTFEGVGFTDLLRWLDVLVERHGVEVSGFAVERQAAAGVVNARVTLETSR